MSGRLQFENQESRKQKTALKDELSEPFLISYFLFSLFMTYLLTLLLIGGCVIEYNVIAIFRQMDNEIPFL